MRISAELNSSLKAKFSPEGSDLRNLQLQLVEMLREIDTVCQNNNIPYWLSYGNLLGLVRHGGFIPWDDDLDVAMLREDYEKFLKVAPHCINDRYAIQCSKSDKYYFGAYAKFRDKNSIITECLHQDKYYKYRGVYVDIFPIEKTHKILAKISGRLQNKLVFGVVKHKHERVTLPLYRFLNIVLSSIVYPIFRVFSFVPGAKYRICYGSGFYETTTIENVLPVKRDIFEGVDCNIPSHPEEVLAERYGDFMKLPSVNELHIHLSEISVIK